MWKSRFLIEYDNTTSRFVIANHRIYEMRIASELFIRIFLPNEVTAMCKSGVLGTIWYVFRVFQSFKITHDVPNRNKL